MMEVEIDLSSLEIQDDKNQEPNNEPETPELNETDPFIEEDSAKTFNTCPVRRSGRKIKIIKPLQIGGNRRTIRKPVKLSDGNSTKAIENYYLNNGFKSVASTSLETIYESPKNDSVMSTRKFRRYINLSSPVDLKPNYQKIRKRLNKAKKINGFKPKRNKKGTEELLKKLLERVHSGEDLC